MDIYPSEDLGSDWSFHSLLAYGVMLRRISGAEVYVALRNISCHSEMPLWEPATFMDVLETLSLLPCIKSTGYRLIS